MKVNKSIIIISLASLNSFILISTLYTSIDFLAYIGFLFLFLTLFFSGKFNCLNRSQLAFSSVLISIVLSLVSSIDFSASLIPSIYLMFLILFSISLSKSINSLEDLEKFIFYALLGFLILNFRSFFSGSSELRFSGVVGQPNALGLVSGTGLILAISYLYLFSQSRSTSKTVSLFVILTSLLLVILSGSRGAIISVAISIGYLLLRNIKYNIKITFSLVTSLLFLIYIFRERVVELPLYSRILAVPAAIGVGSVNPNIDTRYKTASNDIRVDIADLAIKGFQDKPILGNGLSTFQYYSDYTYTHSTPLEILFTLGSLGSFIFVFLIFFSFIAKSSSKNIGIKRFTIIKNFVLIYFLIAGLSIPNFQNKSQIIIYVFLLFIVNGLYKNNISNSINKLA